MPISKLGFIVSLVLKWIHLRLGLPCLRCQFQNLVSSFFIVFTLVLVCFVFSVCMFWTRGLLFQNLDAPKVRLGLNRPTIHLNSENFHVPQTGFSGILFLMDWILWHSDSPSGHKNTGYLKLSYPRFVHRDGFSVTCFVIQLNASRLCRPSVGQKTHFPETGYFTVFPLGLGSPS